MSLMALFEDKKFILTHTIGRGHEFSIDLSFESEMVFSKVKLIIKLALATLFL